MLSIKQNMKPAGEGDPVLNSKKHKFDALTFLAPLTFMLLHAIFLNLAAMGVVVIYSFVADISFSNFSNPEAIERLFLDAQAQNWASVLLGVVMIPVYLIYLRYRGRTYPDILLKESLTPKHWLTGFTSIMGSLGFSMLWISFLIYLGNTSTWLKEQYQAYINAVQSLLHVEGYFWLEILAVVIVIPIVEELLFRGILQGEVRRVAPPWLAVLMSAVAFALFHIMPFQIAFVIIPGLVLALVYELTRNIVIPIFMHMVYNFFGSGVFSRLVGLPEDSAFLLYAELVFIPIGIVFVIFLIRERGKVKAQV